MRPKPFLLVILDGVGNNPSSRANAVKAAKTPCLELLRTKWPSTEIITCGTRVGLPEGQMGNSEVGHLNIGAGRVIETDLARINRVVKNHRLGDEQSVSDLFTSLLAKPQGTLHLVGLVSLGGVHSYLEHLQEMVRAALAWGLRRIAVHVITDGRDRPTHASLDEVGELVQFIDRERAAYPEALLEIASVCGRYYAMDRDNRWERTLRAYDLLTAGVGITERDPIKAIRDQHRAGVTDEFLEPVVCGSTKVTNNDSLLFFNFRADRMRQIVSTFLPADDRSACRALDTRPRITPSIATLTNYDADFNVRVLFPQPVIRNHLGGVISAAGLRQLRIAETEKYPHVTYFFNGGVEDPLQGEERILVPSPRDVPTYDLKPQMSAPEVTEKLVSSLRSGVFDVAIVNYANCDMVGHTGVFDAAVKAVETVDAGLSQLLAEVDRADGMAIVTADHGNAEQMEDYDTGQPHTYHTTFPVPFFLFGKGCTSLKLVTGGALCDIAPTALELLGLQQPPEMTGRSLIVRE